MNGYEIAEKYRITVLNHSMFLECDDVCLCGHHASSHRLEGSAGYCEECDSGKKLYGGAYAHNFIPRDARSFSWELYKKVKEAINDSFLEKRDLLRLVNEIEVSRKIVPPKGKKDGFWCRLFQRKKNE